MKFTRIGPPQSWQKAWPEKGIVWKDAPEEGKISLYAEIDGLFTVNIAALMAVNMVDEVMCATIHSHTLVKKGEMVAASRAIPLLMKKAPIERAAAIASKNGGILNVRHSKKPGQVWWLPAMKSSTGSSKTNLHRY
jgi:hypothetical protein